MHNHLLSATMRSKAVFCFLFVCISEIVFSHPLLPGQPWHGVILSKGRKVIIAARGSRYAERLRPPINDIFHILVDFIRDKNQL